MDAVKRLVQMVTRAYYDNAEIIIMDILVHNDSVRDDQLALASSMTIKELQKICGKLKLQGLIQVESRWEELKPNEIIKKDRERRKLNRAYYYINYEGNCS